MLSRKIQLPEQVERITIGKHHLHYRIVGTGMPLVLIHGYGVSGQSWQHVLPYLAQQHQVIIVDLPGYGQSKISGTWQLREMAPLLARWLDKLGLKSVALVGHSMGGAIAIHLAAHRPEKISKLVLVNSAGLSLQAHLPQMTARLVHSVLQTGNGHPPLPLIRDILQPRFPVLWQTAQQMKHSDFSAELAQIQAPTLIIWGQRDVMLPIELGYRLKELLPHATFTIIPHCGHRPMWGDPALFSQTVLAFLRS